MGTWQAPQVTNDMSNEELRNLVAILIKDMDYLLNGYLDSKNLKVNGIETKNLKAESITTDKLTANSITSDKIQANAITSNKIQAGAVTAEKMTVEQLSAISANLGIVTAGSITSETTINVGTDISIGSKIFMNASSFTSDIVFFPGGYIYGDPAAQSIKIVAPGGVYANGKRIDV